MVFSNLIWEFICICQETEIMLDAVVKKGEEYILDSKQNLSKDMILDKRVQCLVNPGLHSVIRVIQRM